MQKLLLVSVAVGAMAVGSTISHAADGTFRPYVTVFGGGVLPGKLESTRRFDGRLWDIVSSEPGFIFGGTVGFQINDNLRAEVEISRAAYAAKEYTLKDSGFPVSAPTALGATTKSVRATYLLANAWYDIKTDSAFTPYLGGGAGIGWVGGNVDFLNGLNYGFGNEKTAGFAFQIGVGLKTDLTDNLVLDVGYRFKDILGASMSNLNLNPGEDFVNVNLASHNLEIGLTYKF
jgi:opacity protein-like surface antigen